MSLISMKFLIFVLVCVLGYYIIPKKFQWMWLLVFSYIYYASSRIKITVFLLFSTLSTYLIALFIERIPKTEKTKRKIALITGLILNFGMLGALKYTNFLIDNINNLISVNIQPISLLLPLGISFYTFQSMGYLLDVYWEKIEAEKNVFRFALFVSFFPQILQGPIGRFDRLSKQLFAEHEFDLFRVKQAFLRILWGFFKKMVLADNAGRFVDIIFDNYTEFPGMAIIGALCYSAQLYGDFSGGMDVVIGIAMLFGIELDENFKQPFFAKSITDFWHRWHITLGTWMKDYVFYPLTLSKFMNKISKFAKKKINKNFGRALPVCLTNIIVFLLVGVWHGAAWKFIVYGLYNGIIIAFSGFMAQTYKKWKKNLNINEKAKWWTLFQIIRTFILVNISWFFDRADTVEQAFIMIRNSFTRFSLSPLINGEILAKYDESRAFTIISIGIIIISALIVFAVSVLKERGINVCYEICKKPAFIYAFICLVLLFLLPMAGHPTDMTGGFIYAQF